MSHEEMLAQQFNAFHAAIVDSCGRSNRPQQTDAMALRLRNNALAMTKLQLTLLPLARGSGDQTKRSAEPLPEAKQAAQSPSVLEPQSLPDPQPNWTEPEPWLEQDTLLEPVAPETAAPAVEPVGDHVLTGDALSRFVSQRLDPGESAYQAWQNSLREAASSSWRDATQLHGGQASGRRPPDVKAGST